MVNVPGVSCSGAPSHAFWEGTGKGSYMDDVNEGLSQKAVFGCCHDPHTVIKKKNLLRSIEPGATSVVYL